MLLAMDVNGENRAFSDAMLARLESEFGNVNRIPIPRIIYEEDNPENGGTEASLTTVIKWGINSQDKSLFDTMQTEINVENQAEALNFSNKNSERYGYLSMRDMGVYDNEDFDFTLALPPGTESHFPGIMLRADYRACNRDHFFPDNAGYNITLSADHLYWQIKKSGVVVAHFIGSNLSPFTQRKLTISKRGPAIKLFVNDKLIGRYNELHKWQKSQFKSVLLFLRPGQASKIASLEYKRAPLSGIEQIGSRPIAEFPRKDTEPLRFSVVSRTVLSGPKAVEMVELIDLSILEKRIRNLEEERARIMSLIRAEHKPVSESPLFLKLLNDLPRVAQSELTVLIEGETGTGKEVMAKAIHDSSKRAGKPFVKIDCMTIPENLIESELFGHEKGAFTGANTARDGRIAQAEGGTLFLDEISNMPINVQMKLLSVLQDRKYHRLGGTGSRNANVRFIAASNKKLTDLIKAGLFREDLYYRLNQVIYVLPPLRERKVDIPLLSRYFLQEAAHINGIGTVTLATSAVRALMNHSWPGNIRELRNTVIRSALFAENGVIDEKNIVFEIGERVDDVTTNSNRKRRYYPTKESLQELVNKYNGNISEVARKLGATRQTVYRFIKRFGIKLPSYL
ncbi:MAG: sigma-54-dependent Fis family transcriptional regulator [Fibrobacteres bacterium]|nr:sigma-54-dependent Fis family transcriptional regulator [Fibrobacterota bacterium]